MADSRRKSRPRSSTSGMLPAAAGVEEGSGGSAGPPAGAHAPGSAEGHAGDPTEGSPGAPAAPPAKKKRRPPASPRGSKRAEESPKPAAGEEPSASPPPGPRASADPRPAPPDAHPRGERATPDAGGSATEEPGPPPSVGDEVEGTVERILFHDERSSYTVARVRTASGAMQTVVGSFPTPRDGAQHRFVGQWVEHPTYGRQLSANWHEEVLPTTRRGIERYLSSGIVKGLREGLARRIVDHFGEDTLRIIEHEPERLAEVPRLTNVTRQRLIKALEENRATRAIMTFLAGHDISPNLAARIYKAFGADCIEVIQKNPYRMADEIWGVGFKISDRVAQKMGLPVTDPFRLKAGLLHALREAQENGHFYLPPAELLQRAAQLLEVEAESLELPLEKARAAGDLIEEDDSVWLPQMHRLEVRVAERVRERCETVMGRPEPSPALIGEVQRQLGDIPLAALQVDCLRQALTAGMFIMTGGPGTGKTTTVRGILELCHLQGLDTLLAAPTGRAARRMSEATGAPARTLHRLLEYSPTENTFKRNRERPLEADVVIVDEMSMVDAWLFDALLRSLPAETHLVLVGDKDQLPSVGAGSILRDLIASRVVPVVSLRHIFRQGQGSLIVENAHGILQGEMPRKGNADSDFFFVQVEEKGDVGPQAIDIAARRLPKRYNLDPRNDIQVIAPMYRGGCGVNALNTALQARVNPDAEQGPAALVTLSNGKATVGDKVMQLRNDYEKNVFNGDMGVICHVDEDEQTFRVRLFGAPSLEGDDALDVDYEFGDGMDLALAYACTIHKSQGSEFPAVVIALSTEHYIMLQRNLLYTALTRARRLAVIVGSERALRLAIQNDKVEGRYTRLAARLQESPP